MVEGTAGYKGQVNIVWWLFLIFLWAVFVVNPDIDVNVSVNILCIKEANFKSGVSVPFEINFAF